MRSLDTGKQLLLVTPLLRLRRRNTMISWDRHSFSTQVSSIWWSTVSSIESDPTTNYALPFFTGQSYKDSLSTLRYPETSVTGIKLLAASQLMLEIHFCQPDEQRTVKVWVVACRILLFERQIHEWILPDHPLSVVEDSNQKRGS